MSKQLSYLTAGTVTFLLSAGPALADVVVPEPATMTLFGAGVAVAALIGRHRRRK